MLNVSDLSQPLQLKVWDKVSPLPIAIIIIPSSASFPCIVFASPP
jgi:hypothetical protein